MNMGDKQNDVVIDNPQNNRENIKMHVHIPYTCIFMIYICTHIY